MMMMMMRMWSTLVAEVLGGVDINWSPPITDWSHHYGYHDGDDEEEEDDDGVEYCCIIYSKHLFL